MAVPISQMWAVARYVITQKLKGRKRYPLVLMLEPLFRCNLACAGCGKIQYPAHILHKQLTPEECFAASDECGTPIVSIPGGEPLLHPQIGRIVQGLVDRKKFVYLCTNAILLEEKLQEGIFQPSKYLTFSVHMDGTQANHDFAVCREGVFEKAASAIRLAVTKGFRVTVNATLFDGANPADVREYFDQMSDLGVEGMMISPGYAYPKAPDQVSFMRERGQTNRLFQTILTNRKSKWKFNQSPLYLEFLMGKRDFECTPWGNPTYNIFGWQKPCYLLQDGYTQTFQELMDQTEWDRYGRASGNPSCQQCMVHCGYEPTAVDHTFGSFEGMWATVKAMIRRTCPDEAAALRLQEAQSSPRGPHAHLTLNGKSLGSTAQEPAPSGEVVQVV